MGDPILTYPELNSYKDRANLFLLLGDRVCLYNDTLFNPPKLSNLYSVLGTERISFRSSEDYTQKTIQISWDSLEQTEFKPNIKAFDELLHQVKIGSQFPMIRDKLILEFNYQIEHVGTGEVVKLKSDRLVLRNLHHYIYEKLSTSATFMDQMLITNYQESLIHVVTEYIHGNREMLCRLRDVRLYYEMIQDEEASIFTENRYYHFSKDKEMIVPHKDLVENDRSIQYELIPIQTIPLDYTFRVRTNDHLTFVFNIWNSGLIVSNNAKLIYDTLLHQNSGNHQGNEFLLNELQLQKRMLQSQQQEIHNLNTTLNNLGAQLKRILDKMEGPIIVPDPNIPIPPDGGCCKPHRHYMVPPYGAALDFRCNVKTKDLEIVGIHGKGE